MKNFAEQLKEYFNNTPKDVINKEFKETQERYKDVGPTVDEYFGYVESIKKKEKKHK